MLADLKLLPNTWAVKIQQASIVGTPDILACVGGRFVALELKRDAKAKTSKIQDYHLKKISEAGGAAMVITPKNWVELLAKLRILAE